MQVHGPSVIIKDTAREISAYLNHDFAVVNIGPVTVYVRTPAEADALIAVAAEAKRLLDPPAPPGARQLYPCCEHCTPLCGGPGHGKPCLAAGCPSGAQDPAAALAPEPAASAS